MQRIKRDRRGGSASSACMRRTREVSNKELCSSARHVDQNERKENEREQDLDTNETSWTERTEWI